MEKELPVSLNGKVLFWEKSGKPVTQSDLIEGMQFTIVRDMDTHIYIERKLNG